MNRWERNHFLLAAMVEWREKTLADSVERLLIRIGRKYRRMDIVPHTWQMVEELEPVMPFVRNLVAAAGISGATEAVLRANYDLRTPYNQYFRHGALPNQVTLEMVWKYLEAVGYDRGQLAEQMRAHTRRMKEQIAVVAQRKIQESIVEGISQKWTLKRMQNQVSRSFDGLKKEDVTAVMPNVETVVRTESMTILHASSWSSSQCTPTLQAMLWGFEYFAVGDARTRPTHDAQDGVTAEKNSHFWDEWYPPNGYNCRCSAHPLYDEPSRKKEPRWNLHPDKGFAFNPGRSKPFNMGMPKAAEPPKTAEKQTPKPVPQPVVPITIPAQPITPATTPPENTKKVTEKSTQPIDNSGFMDDNKNVSVVPPAMVKTPKKKTNVPQAKTAQKPPQNAKTVPVEPKPEKPKTPHKQTYNTLQPVSQQEIVQTLFFVRNLYGSDVVKRLSIVPTATGCDVYWDNDFIASVEFEEQTEDLQLSLNIVRWFKAVFRGIRKKFSTLWDAVKWVLDKQGEAKKEHRKLLENRREIAKQNRTRREAKLLNANLIKGEHTIKQDLAATNPMNFTKKPEWTHNCQRCVTAYEARRRGIDVVAKPIKDLKNDKLSGNKKWADAYVNPHIIDCSGHAGKGGGQAAKKNILNALSEMPDGARCIVQVLRSKTQGHVFIAERIKGKTVFHDPQPSGKPFQLEASENLKGIRSFYAYVCRVDNLKFSEVAQECAERRLK